MYFEPTTAFTMPLFEGPPLTLENEWRADAIAKAIRYNPEAYNTEQKACGLGRTYEICALEFDVGNLQVEYHQDYDGLGHPTGLLKCVGYLRFRGDDALLSRQCHAAPDRLPEGEVFRSTVIISHLAHSKEEGRRLIQETVERIVAFAQLQTIEVERINQALPDYAVDLAKHAS